jgi:DNA topoisomerase-3
LPTPTGIQLIDTIQNDLVVSRIDRFLENSRKDIEKGTCSAGSIINNMKQW